MGTLAPMLVCVMAGCTSTGGFTAPWNKTAAKADAPKDNLILTGGRGLEREPIDPGLRQELDTAKRLMLDKKYAEAAKLFDGLVGKFERESSAEFLAAAARCYQANHQNDQAAARLQRVLDEFSDTSYAARARVQLAILKPATN